MKLKNFQSIHDGKYLHAYELTYENKSGQEKTYEMVSRNTLSNESALGNHVDGISIAAIKDDKLLLLREFRMAINREIYNLCAGMIEKDESIEDCICRELYEETGLHIHSIRDILPPAFSAVGISDIKTVLAFVEVEGDFEDHTSSNEQIHAAFYTKEQLQRIIAEEQMSDRAQLAAYYFISTDGK